MRKITIAAMILQTSCLSTRELNGKLKAGDSCLKSNSAGATPAQIKDAMAAVLIEFEQDGQTMYSICSAASIGPHTLLTAAHCTNHANISKLTARSGTEVFATGPNGAPKYKEYTVGVYTHHPQALEEGKALPLHDLSLLYIDEEWEGSSLRVQTSELFTYPVGHEVQTAGYGVSSVEAKDSGTLRAGTDVISEDNDTWFRTSGSPYTSQGLPGDSGGPAIYNGAIIGVLSTRNEEMENAYTKTTEHGGYLNDGCGTEF
jgi:hypothetical protein